MKHGGQKEEAISLLAPGGWFLYLYFKGQKNILKKKSSYRDHLLKTERFLVSPAPKNIKMP